MNREDTDSISTTIGVFNRKSPLLGVATDFPTARLRLLGSRWDPGLGAPPCCPTTWALMFLPIDTIRHDRYFAESLHLRIVAASRINVDGMDVQALVNDFDKLPPNWREEPFELLREGDCSPHVADFILTHTIRGSAVQHLGPDDWLLRCEVARRLFIQLNPGVREKSPEEWQVYLGLASDSDASAPVREQGGRVCPEKFEYEPRGEAEILGNVAQFSPVTQDLLVQLFLSHVSTELMCVVLWHCAEGGPLSHCPPAHLLYPVEWVRRRLNRLESEWEREHRPAGVHPSYEAKADYLRHAMRSGLRIAGETPPSLCPEQFHFNLEEIELLSDQFAGWPGHLQEATTKRLRSGFCAEAVTRWLMERPDGGVLRPATFPQLLRILEYRRRGLFYGFVDPVGRDVDDAISIARRRECLSGLAALSDSGWAACLRLLREGGWVEASAARPREPIEAAAVHKDLVTDRGRPWLVPPPRNRKEKPAKLSFRQQKGKGMLRTLQKLPRHVREEAMKLLAHGCKATIVARFVLSHEELGHFPRLAQNTVRQYLEHAVKVVERAEQSAKRKRLVVQVAKVIRQEQICHRSLLQAQRSAARANRDVVKAVESLAAIKQKLAALLAVDSDHWLPELLAERERVTSSKDHHEQRETQNTATI